MADHMKRRVLFLIPTLTGGGAERVIVTLLRNLDRSKFELSLAVVDTRDAVFLADLPRDVEFIDLHCSRVRYALSKIIRLIRQRHPDVVFSTLSHLNLALAMVRSLLPRTTWLIAREAAVLSYDLTHYSYPRVWAWAYRRFYGRIDQVVCQSIEMREDLITNFGVPAHKAVLINNPCDIGKVRKLTKEYIPADDLPEVWQNPCTIKLVAAGRLVPQKGFDLLIDAVAICANPSIHLLILGKGPLRDQLLEQADARGVSAQITFTGFKRNPYAYIVRADAFVLSSRYEGFPNVVLEALACGTPVIATPAPGGVREILGNVSACVVAGNISARSLAKALGDWISGSQSRIPTTAAQPYGLEQIVGEYERQLSSGREVQT